MTLSYAKDANEYVYFSATVDDKETQQKHSEITNEFLDKTLRLIGREALKEKTPSIEDLKRSLQGLVASQDHHEQDMQNMSHNQQTTGENTLSGASIVAQLIQKGYLKESDRWLTDKGFMNIGRNILKDITKALQAGDLGMHETKNLGRGGVVLDSTKSYERGDGNRALLKQVGSSSNTQ